MAFAITFLKIFYLCYFLYGQMRIPGNAPGPAEQSRSSTGVSKSADRIPERHVSSEDVRPQAPGRVGEQRE